MDFESKQEISRMLGEAIDQLTTDLYSNVVDGVSAIQEPEISSRLCQRLEDRLDGTRAGDYVFRVIAQSVPDRGRNSMEKLLGADIFLSISLEGAGGFDKGIFIQAKYDRNIDRDDIQSAVKKMKKTAGNNGAYVWVYTPSGTKVFSANQVERMANNSFHGQKSRSIEGFAGRVINCYAGSRRWGIAGSLQDRRALVARRLREARAKNILDLRLDIVT